MKNLRITESCLVNGQHVEAGTIMKDVDKTLAAELVANGRAVSIEDIETRDPVAEHRDPKPAKKAK